MLASVGEHWLWSNDTAQINIPYSREKKHVSISNMGSEK